MYVDCGGNACGLHELKGSDIKYYDTGHYCRLSLTCSFLSAYTEYGLPLYGI